MEQAQVIKYWQTAEVGVLCSNSEGMPVCLMEAAACGIPVVSTSVGGVTGLLTPPGDVEGMSAALAHLLSEPRLREQMGSAARARATSHFSLQHQVDQLLELWSGIVRDHKNESSSCYN
jgi:glycosyltransferase involved in cell wall biosynthesis